MTGEMVKSYVCVVIVAVAWVAAGVAGMNWYEYPTLLKPAVVETNQNFGMTLALDDNYLVIGTNMEDANGVTDIGTVTIFQQDSGQWGEMEQIIPTDGQASDHFGSDVNIHNGVVIIGDRAAAIAIYRYSGSQWTRDELKNETDSSCGYSVEIYGNYAVYGCPLQDKVKIYKLNTSTTRYFTSTPFILTGPVANKFFGDELAIYGDFLAVSSQDVIYVYTTLDNGSTWTSDANITVSPLLRKDGAYGRALSMYGGRLVVAANDSNADATVKTYKRTTGPTAWTLGQSFTESYTGVSVSMYNTNLIAGFYEHKSDSTAAGNVKVYRLSGDTWTYDTSLTGHDVENGDMYGRSVAAWGNYFVTGSPYYDSNNGGAVYIFDSSASTVNVQVIPGTISLSFTMTLYPDETFTSPVQGDITVTNTDDIYVGVKETNTNSYFKFIVKRCWATPSSSSSDSTSYDLYADRCPQDESFQTVTSNDDEFNFKFRAFNFASVSGQSIYIHCELLICLTSDTTTSCMQACTTCDTAPCVFSKRRRRSAGRGALANFVLASRRIIYAPLGCLDTTCPTHSTCLRLSSGTSACVCDNEHVMSVKTNKCIKERVIRMNRVLLPLIMDSSRTASSNLTEISIANEKTLWSMLHRDCDRGCDNIFDGIRLVNARRETSGVVFDVLLLYQHDATRKLAYKRFTEFLAATGLSETSNGPNLGFPSQKNAEKNVFKKWVYILIIVGVICASIIVIPMSIFVVRRTRLDSKSLERKKTKMENEDTKVGRENIGLDVKEEEERPPDVVRCSRPAMSDSPIENPYS